MQDQTLPGDAVKTSLSAITAGMYPAFQDQRNGEVRLAQIDGCCPAPAHTFDGLPAEWIVERDEQGDATTLHPAIRAGFYRANQFIAFERCMALPLDG